MSDDEKDYWHGGVSGISVGDRISSRAGGTSSADKFRRDVEQAVGYDEVRDPNRVYYTTDREVARAWASRIGGGGSLYRVIPVFPNSCAPDTDYPTVAFSTPELEVVAVEETNVRLSREDRRSRVMKYHTWDDGSPQYDADGYFQPPPQHREFGKTAAQYRHIPRWYPLPQEVSLYPAEGRIEFPTVPSVLEDYL